MAIVEVKVPQLSESVSEATMLQWKKKPGEAVAQDEILIELETDKVVLEVPAPAAGVLAQVLQNDGDTVVADQVIATIDTEAKAGAAAAAAGACSGRSLSHVVAAPAPPPPPDPARSRRSQRVVAAVR
ncbi:biotin/lipoyl-containing protein, partial [Burkholderia pseudomallei]|uniref:biotin/lipoyl-containing protein n=1 Tax=Burkholderia pseudomallei TaxID=28450 RepID=UPI002116A66E